MNVYLRLCWERRGHHWTLIWLPNPCSMEVFSLSSMGSAFGLWCMRSSNSGIPKFPGSGASPAAAAAAGEEGEFSDSAASSHYLESPELFTQIHLIYSPTSYTHCPVSLIHTHQCHLPYYIYLQLRTVPKHVPGPVQRFKSLPTHLVATKNKTNKNHSLTTKHFYKGTFLAFSEAISLNRSSQSILLCFWALYRNNCNNCLTFPAPWTFLGRAWLILACWNCFY